MSESTPQSSEQTTEQSKEQSSGPIGRLGAIGRETRSALRVTFSRRDGVAIVVTVSFLYLVAYLWAIGHLAPGLGGFDVAVVERPLAKFFQPELGPFSFTPVARVAIGPLTYLASANTVIGGVVAVLAGLNLGLTYVAWRRPKSCGFARSSAGVLASVPAILSGTACCGPVILLALGIQASGLLVATLQWLLPASILLLVGSLLLVAQRVAPATSASVTETPA